MQKEVIYLAFIKPPRALSTPAIGDKCPSGRLQAPRRIHQVDGKLVFSGLRGDSYTAFTPPGRANKYLMSH